MKFDQEKTDEIKLNPRYQNLLKWGLDNGVIIKDVDMPAAFGELTGVVATKDIPANTAIICVPQPLIISQEKCKLSSLSIVYDKHPELFDENETSDAEFNILIFYLFNEKKKGEKSFYHPYVQAIQSNNTLIDWTKEELNYIEDPIILDEFAIVREDLKELWNQAKDIFNEFIQIFGETRPTDKEDFYWAAQSVMSRCFGWSLKSTSMIPIADFLNHSNKACTHYLVHSKIEKLEQEKLQAKKDGGNEQNNDSDEDSFMQIVHDQYKLKGNKINLNVLNIKQDESQLKKFIDPKNTYILQHQQYLTENQLKDIDNLDNISNADKRAMINWINYEQMIQNSQVNLWDLGFVTSSDSEDNDSDEDVEVARNKQFETLKIKELSDWKLKFEEKKQQKNQRKEKNEQEIKKEQQIEQSIEQPIVEQNQEVDKEQSDGELKSQTDNESILTICLNNEKKNLVTIKGLPPQQIQALKQRQQQMLEVQQQKQQIQSFIQEQKQQQNKDNESDSSEESKWDWLEENDKDVYFCITTTEPIKKHEQVTVSYGRRTNRFLLSWYGFTLPENKYSSFNFRLWLNTEICKEKILSQKQIFDTITINKLISPEEWDSGKIKFNGNEIPISSITKEFRIKKNKLNMDLLMYLRLYLMLYQVQIKDVLITIPVSVDYEVFVMQFCIQLLQHYLNSYSQELAQDIKELETQISFSRRFALHINKERKEILINQIMILLDAIIILKKYKESNDLKQSYISEIHNNVYYKMEILRGLKKLVKFVILPYKNALPIKFNLQIGANMIGNTQEHEICINNKQIVNNHCCVILNEDEIELIVLDGPVFYKNEDGQFEQLAKDSILSLNIECADFSIRLGQCIEAKVQVVNGTQHHYLPRKQPQKEIKQFNLQERLSTIEVKIVESLYTSQQSELEQLQQGQEQEQNNIDDINSISIIQQQTNNLEQQQQNIQKSNFQQIKQNEINQKTDILQLNDYEQQTEMLSNGTPDFNNNQKDLKKIQNNTSNLDYLIIPQRKDRESSPKKKSNHKLMKEIKKESYRMSQRKCNRWKFCIAFSGFHPSRDEQQFLLLQNIQICLEDYNFNMLIMEDNVELRSIKLLIALAKGIPIISRNWLTRSINQYEILDHNQYQVQFSNEFCREYNFDFKQYQKRLQKCKEAKIFPLKGVTIFVPKRMIYHIEHFELEYLVESLGGKLVHQIHDDGEAQIYMLIPKDQTKIIGYDKYQQSPIECLFKSALKFKNLL
ncbi:unnamed protein product [Paramecium pentaurelia]|uniref:BRCT domain-containing protein n=1 Tax=Paramecium pentaurelia TaxID=43138 RepID=A0A8S1TKS1_9CILI|nr:unnamed protein product [Paramecium pentaurelia]